MPKAALVTTEKKSAKPVLIVDKEGDLGKHISLKLKDEFLIVFVSSKSLTEENVVSVPFSKKIPSIPDNTFSHIILVAEQHTKQLVKIFQKKAQKDGAKFSLIFKKQNSNKKIAKDALDFYSNTNVLIIDEIFAEDFIFDPKTDLSKLIIDAKSFGKVEIVNDGSKEASPIILQDALDAILEAIFVEEKSKVFYIFPKNNTTLLSLALMLKKKNPHLKLDFIKQKPIETKLDIPEGGRYLLETPYNFEDKIKKIDLEKIKVEQYLQEKKKITFPKLNFLPLSTFLLTLFVLPILCTFLFLSLGNFLIGRNNSLAEKSYDVSNASFPVLKQEIGFLNFKEISDWEDSLLTNITNLKILTLQKSANEKIKDILIGKSKNPQKDLLEATKNYKEALLAGQQQGSSTDMEKIVSLSDYYPSILAIGETKKYLVLLENCGKLWPGGGKIEYYAILTLENGKIKDFKIFDAKKLNKTLGTRVEPPFAIRRYLPSVNWYFEDSNFDVDFSKDAVAAVTFLNSVNKQKFDGIIAVDSYFFINLLKTIGDVDVKNYAKKISSNNFFDVVSKSSDNNFKEKFFNSFFNKLAMSTSNYDKIFNRLVFLANQKHIIFAFNNQSEQTGFSLNELTSTLLDQRINDVNDFFGISEANFGEYNNQIQRSINQEVTFLADGSILEKTDVSLNNIGQNTYKNYIRFILPLNTDIYSINIDGRKQKIISAIKDPSVYENKKFISPTGLEVEEYDENGKTIFGVLLTVQPSSTKKVSISYNLSKKIGSESSYGVRVFKQPGVDSFSYSLRIISSELKAILYPSSYVLNDSGGHLSTIVDKDIDLDFKFVPK